MGAVEVAGPPYFGTWLATDGQGGTVRIWDAVTGEQRAALTGRRGQVRSVAISPDGT
jgi:WD40 repeat protein